MAIDLRRETPNVAKHIVDAINSMAKIKQEQIKIQQSVMLDQLERKRNLEDYQAKKDIDLKTEQKGQQGMMDMFNPQEQMPQVTQPVTQTVPGPQGGQITGQAQGQTPEAIEQPLFLDGIPMPNPVDIYKSTGKADHKLITYSGLYRQAQNGTLNEGGKKLMLDFIGLDTKEKKENYLFKLPPKAGDIKKKGGFFGLGGTPEINEETLSVIRNIKTVQDLEELMESRDEYEAAGVDIQYILDYYQKEE